MKHLILKCEKDGTCQFEALLEQRNTPRNDTGRTPTEIMFKRKTCTMFPMLNAAKEENDSRRERRKKSVKKYHDKIAQDLPFLKMGQSVYFEHKVGEKWILGKIKNILGNYTYVVQSQDGSIYRRNRINIRPTQVTPHIRDSSPIRATLQPEVNNFGNNQFSGSLNSSINNSNHENHFNNSEPETPDATTPRSQNVSYQSREQLTRIQPTRVQPAQTQPTYQRPTRDRKPPAYLSDYVCT